MTTIFNKNLFINAGGFPCIDQPFGYGFECRFVNLSFFFKNLKNDPAGNDAFDQALKKAAAEEETEEQKMLKEFGLTEKDAQL